jgi:hypothetical protein
MDSIWVPHRDYMRISRPKTTYLVLLGTLA